MTIYLYVKQHSITKLKYFGKTEKLDPFKYLGSGSYWQKHLKKHGKEHIETLEIWGFDDQELCTEFALKFSKDNNIVESDEWANLIPENGLDGLPANFNGHMTPERRKQNSERWLKNNPNNRPGARERMSVRMSGDKNPARRPEVRAKMSKPKDCSNRHVPCSFEKRIKLSNAIKGRTDSDEVKLKKKLSKQNLVWVHNLINKPKQIHSSLLESHIENGYSHGRGPKLFW